MFLKVSFSTKRLGSTNVFNIDDNLEHQISILEWFLDHVTLKTGVMMLEIHLCHRYNF